MSLRNGETQNVAKAWWVLPKTATWTCFQRAEGSKKTKVFFDIYWVCTCQELTGIVCALGSSLSLPETGTWEESPFTQQETGLKGLSNCWRAGKCWSRPGGCCHRSFLDDTSKLVVWQWARLGHCVIIPPRIRWRNVTWVSEDDISQQFEWLLCPEHNLLETITWNGNAVMEVNATCKDLKHIV